MYRNTEFVALDNNTFNIFSDIFKEALNLFLIQKAVRNYKISLDSAIGNSLR